MFMGDGLTFGGDADGVQIPELFQAVGSYHLYFRGHRQSMVLARLQDL